MTDQIFNGPAGQVAGRDVIINQAESRVDVMAWATTATSSELDALAADNERFFKLRFGFFASQIQRERVLALQRQYTLSDDEIRRLRAYGILQLGRDSARLAPAPLSEAVGWVSAGFLFLLAIALLIAERGFPLIGSITVATLVLMAGFAVVIFVAPSRIARQAIRSANRVEPPRMS